MTDSPTVALEQEPSTWFLPVAIIVLAVLICAVFVARQVKPVSALLQPVGVVPPFTFTDQTNRAFGRDSLVAGNGSPGKVWIADFIFTSCAGPCPVMTLQMRDVQAKLAGTPEVHFVSFSVDPERDTPEVLAKYAADFGAASGWSFLTGDRNAIYDLAQRGFFLAAGEQRRQAGLPLDASLTIDAQSAPAADPEHAIFHSTLFALVDHTGGIRGYYDGTKPEQCDSLVRAAHVLVRDMRVPPAAAALPAVNATFNAACTLLLIAGFILIRKGRLEHHRIVMVAAFVTSILFLAGYLTYHLGLKAGTTRFAGPASLKPVYAGILLTHTILAAVIVPLVLLTLARGLRGQFSRHRWIARVTLPLWLYVSGTGVLIYLVLYHIYPAAGLRL